MSLVTTPNRDLATCGQCAGQRVTAIRMTLTDGSIVDFASCHSCEHRTWTQRGRPLAFSSIVAKATKHKPGH